jgi:hypothetical protein
MPGFIPVRLGSFVAIANDRFRNLSEAYVRTRPAVSSHLKSLRENQALHIQPRRGDLNVAQDAVLGCIQEEISSPGGTAESILARFSRPSPGLPVELGASANFVRLSY